MFPFWFSGKIHGQDQQISVAGNHSEDSDKTEVEKITKELIRKGVIPIMYTVN